MGRRIGTIAEAIERVMTAKGVPLSPQEIYAAIVERGLYEFHAQNPVQIVNNEIRRHCEGLDFPSARKAKYFQSVGPGKYFLCVVSSQKGDHRRRERAGRERSQMLLKELKTLHARHRASVQEQTLNALKKLDPTAFEVFARNLLRAYGFHEVRVTQVTKDGGIDGHGKLKVGLAFLNVAFQCKRWVRTKVGRPEIDRFRGAIQGQFEQGIFFTTSRFAPGAEGASFRPGAVPVILIDGDAIIEMMFEKRFGMEVETLPVYSYALDLALAEE